MEPHSAQTHGVIVRDSLEGSPRPGSGGAKQSILDADVRLCSAKCNPDRDNFTAYTDAADTVLAARIRDDAQCVMGVVGRLLDSGREYGACEASGRSQKSDRG